MKNQLLPHSTTDIEPRLEFALCVLRSVLVPIAAVALLIAVSISP